MRVTESVEIRRDPEAVWELVCDRARDVEWCEKVRRVEQAGPSAWNVWHRPIPLRPAVRLVVEHESEEPPVRLTMREEDAGSVFLVSYELEPTAAGTRFTQTSDFQWKRLPRPLQRLLALGVRRDIRRQLRDLKRTLESHR